MIHLIAGVVLFVACVTLVRNAWVIFEQGNQGSALAHFVVAVACAVGAIRAWWRWRKDTARRLARKRAPQSSTVTSSVASSTTDSKATDGKPSASRVVKRSSGRSGKRSKRR